MSGRPQGEGSRSQGEDGGGVTPPGWHLWVLADTCSLVSTVEDGYNSSPWQGASPAHPLCVRTPGQPTTTVAAVPACNVRPAGHRDPSSPSRSPRGSFGHPQSPVPAEEVEARSYPKDSHPKSFHKTDPGFVQLTILYLKSTPV